MRQRRISAECERQPQRFSTGLLPLDLTRGGVMHEGVYSTRLGLKGIPSAAESTMVSRDLILTEMTNGKYHVGNDKGVALG